MAKEFRDIMKYLRKQKDLTQRELADKLGVSNSSIASYETGLRLPDRKTEEKIADFFGVSIAYLRGEEGNYARIELDRAVHPDDYVSDEQVAYEVEMNNKLDFVIELTNRTRDFNEKERQKLLDYARLLCLEKERGGDKK